MEKQHAGVGWPRHWTRKFFSRRAGSFTAIGLLLALALALPLGTMAQAAGTPWAWGYNWAGQLGDGTTTNSNVPVQVLDLTGVMAIAGGSYHHSLALMVDGTVRAWGSGNNGQLGIGTGANSSVPVQVLGLTGVTAIAGGQDHSFAIKNDGTAWAWGWNVFGQLGNGTTTTSFIPVQVMGIAGVTALSGGGFHSLALKNDGTVWTWGYNYFGQLGNGTTTASNLPVQVSSLAGMTAIAGAVNHSLALKNDGKVWAWGHNWNGALGNGTNTDSNLPVQVLGLAGVTAIAGVGEHSLALKNDGTVWAWGYNSSGQLGNGTNTSSNVPVQVIGLMGVSAIGGGGDNSLALKNDGTVWAWGHNIFGQLGDGTNTNSNVPVQVFGLTGVSAIGGCGYHALALRSAASCVPPPPGMVAWYGLDEQTGATTIADSAPSPGSIVNNAGTPQPGSVGQGGPSHVTGMVGAGALYFTGPYVDVTPQVELDFDRGDFSIDAWVRPVPCGAAGFLSPVVDKWDTTNNPTGFSLFLTQTAQYSASITLQFNAQTFTSTGSFTADASTWHHIAVTISRAIFPGTGIFYIDGAPAGTFVPPAGTLTNTLPMWIGKTRVPGGLCEIAIDELELFNREITHAEVQGIHDALSAGKCRCVPPPSGMVAWWPLDETSGTAAADIVPLPAVPHPGTVQPGPIGSSVSTGPVSSIYWPLAPWNFLPGMVANSLAFTEHDRIEVPTAPALEPGASGFTVDAWVIYQPDPVGGPSVIISKMNPAGGPGYVLGIPGGLLKFQVIGSSASLTATALVAATPGIWHHVAATLQRNPDTLLLYVDGGLLPVTATTATIGGVMNGSMVLIGGNGGFAGLLGVDEVEIFNRALELSEVKLLSDARASGKCKVTACTLTCTASASVSSGSAPLAVTFTGGATVSDGSTPSFSWVFGDGQSSTDQSPRHAYTTCGTFTWTLTVAACGQTCTQTGTITVTGCCPTIFLSPITLPDGSVGVVYNQTITASGGTAPYTFAVTVGSLAPGLSLNGSSGALAGTPSATGSFPFTITATDAHGCSGTMPYTLAVTGCANPPVWTPTAPMATARQGHTGTLLLSGKVLVAGGHGSSNPSSALASCELYNPTPGTWSATGAMVTARGLLKATLMPNGNVLVAGGWDASGNPLASAEIYDPVAGTWSATGPMTTALFYHTMTLLPNGKVLVAGGTSGSSPLATAQVYDPVAGTWSATGSMATARNNHTATLLPNGKVLVAGGFGGILALLASAEIYDPAVGTWSATSSMTSARGGHTATLLSNGKVLVAGGLGTSGLVAGAEIYDPAAGTWSPTGAMATARFYHSETLLLGGKILVAGGSGNSGYLSNSEAYDPAAGTWSSTGSMAATREFHTATRLPNGKVLVTGGWAGSLGLAGAELFDPAPCCPMTITLSPTSLPISMVGVYYSQTITASGGTLPYTFAVTAGSLPPGLTLDPSTGVLSGTPTTAGTYGFVVTATDASGCHGSHDYNVSVGAGCSFPITLKPGTIAGGTVGALYTQPINASGGTAPYTYTLSAGSLPPGLTLNPATGVISGTPTTAGTYSFTLTATDANKCTGSAQFSLVVGSCTYGPVVIISIHYTGGWVYINFTGTGILCGDPPIGVDDDWVRADLIKYAKNKGKVKLAFTQNPSATPRRANVFIGGSVFPVEQAGAPCKVSAVSPTKLMVDASGGEQRVAVMAPEGACEWIASPNGSAGSWIDIPSGSGSGPGAVSFRVSPNTTGKNRTGTISVGTALGKKNVTVKQSH